MDNKIKKKFKIVCAICGHSFGSGSVEIEKEHIHVQEVIEMLALKQMSKETRTCPICNGTEIKLQKY